MRIDRHHDTHWVYRCYDADDRLIYVGSTANLFGRLAQHNAVAWWAPTVARVKAHVYPNGVIAREVERAAIRTELPRWNKSGKWASRGMWTREDWHDWFTVLLRGTAGSPPPTWLTSPMATAIADYEALFHSPPPEFFARTFARLENEGRRRDAARQAQQLQRIRQVEREDELALARDRRDGLA